MNEEKKSIQGHPIIMTNPDYDFIMDEIERREILSLKGMWVLIVMRNHIDDNNNNAIFNLGFYYMMIKNEYVNIIWFFVFFFWI